LKYSFLFSLTDIDECVLGKHTCHENATCLNLVGGYDCRCNTNFRGDGFDCQRKLQYRLCYNIV